MTLHRPVPLDASHLLEPFDCGEPILNDWLAGHARQAQAGGSAKTFIVTDDDQVVGYYNLTVGQINAIEAPARARKGMGRYPLPVVILARLAVSRECHGRGIGRGLLQDAIGRTLAIAEQAGVRAMLTHPLPGTAGFYERFGFIPSPLKENQLLLLLKDAKKLLAGNYKQSP